MAKLTKFQDFKNKEEEKELQDLKRTYTKNTVDTQQFPRNTKYNFNYITRKMDDLSVDEVEDKIEELEEALLYNSETHKYEQTPTGLETVGELIERLKQYDPNTKVAVNVAEEPSEIFEIVETKVEDCRGRGDGLEYTTSWDKEEKVILIKGNQY
jgi:predicted transcriptional regulator